MPSISGISEKESYKRMIKELFQYWKQLHLGLVVLKINLILFLVYSNHFCFLEIIVLANMILVTVCCKYFFQILSSLVLVLLVLLDCPLNWSPVILADWVHPVRCLCTEGASPDQSSITVFDICIREERIRTSVTRIKILYWKYLLQYSLLILYFTQQKRCECFPNSSNQLSLFTNF